MPEPASATASVAGPPGTEPVSVSAIVLCGGRSSRLGRDKTAERLGASTVLDRLLDGLPGPWPVICVGPERPTTRAVDWAREHPPGGGPNAAIAAALDRVTTDLVVVAAGDLPFAAAAARDLADALRQPDPTRVDACYALDADGRVQPLLAAYRTAALRAALPDPPQGTPARLVATRLAHRGVRVEPDAALDVDTEADLDRARERAP